MGVVNIYSGLGEQTNWRLSKSKDHTLTITVQQNSAAFDLSSYTFVAKFYTLDGLKVPSAFLTLTQGSGITNGGATGIITITLTDTQTNLTANEYYWELTTTAPTDDRWFNGVFEIVDYLWDSGNSSSTTVNLTIGGNNLSVALTIAGSSGGSGDVVGPSSATDSNFAAFDTTTGKLLKDSGYSSASFDTSGLAAAVQSNLNSHTSNTSNPHGVTISQLGATTVGGNIFSLTNPSAVTFLRINADNTVDALSAANFLTAIGGWSLSSGGTLTGNNTISSNSSSNRINFSFSSLGGASGVTVTNTATDAASNLQRTFTATTSGANSTSGQTTYSGFFSNTKTGTSSTNVGLYATATGATNNYGIIVESGRVGIGSTAPVNIIHASGATVTSGVGTVGTNFVLQSTNGNALFQPRAGATTSFAGVEYLDTSGNPAVFSGFRESTAEFRFNNVATSGYIDFLIGSSSKFSIANNGNLVCGNAALATNATSGFLYIPTCAGTPTGTPTSYSGRVPMVYDTSNDFLYFYSGGTWKKSTVYA